MSDFQKKLHLMLNEYVEASEYLRIENAIDTYLDLLLKWNKVYNLTAIRELEIMRSLHILDSLAVLPFIFGKNIIDVGTGAGLPGVVLAIVRQDFQVTLLDSNGKKTRFLQEVQRVLGLKNITVIKSRVLDFQPAKRFATVVSRAFTSIPNMQQGSQHLLAKDGILVAMKGRVPTSELADISSPYQVNTYKVPGISGERCCVVIENS